MTSTPKVRPPFAWLGVYAERANLLAVIVTAAFFRFYELATLPPGLPSGSAGIGLQSIDFLEHGILPGMNAVNGYAPIWVLLQAIPVALLGHTELALRLMPATLGTVAVLLTWVWVKQWFGVRVAWLSSLLLAVTPWAVTLSRSETPSALVMFTVSLTMWAATYAHRSSNKWRFVILGVAIALNLLSGPVGWTMVAALLGVGVAVNLRENSLFKLTRERTFGLIALGVGIAATGYILATSQAALKVLPRATGLKLDPSSLASNLFHTLLMFNVRGDENYRHNLISEPMLNAFVGLMLVAGILVGISRLHQRRYRLLFVFLIVMLIPAILSNVGVPNAAHAVGALPFVLVVASIGISYMLELWYLTFPINSAARATGQAAIIVLMALTFFQGYTQYFRAWAGSNEVYAAHNEGADQMARHIQSDKFKGDRYVVAPADELQIVAYLNHRGAKYTPLTTDQLVALPVGPGQRQFVIVAESRDEAVKSLKVKFPGGTLRPHYSNFNQAEIYYTYEVSK